MVSVLQSVSAANRDNNFNLLRMLAATSVLVSHAYPLSLGTGATEPLQHLLGISLGGLAVYSFFIISGYFISQSYDRRPDLLEFAVARILRIYPGLFVVLTVTILILGAIFTILGIYEYFSERATLLYLPQNLLLVKLRYELPGVFVDNPYPQVINGSLWSLSYEVGCYGMVAFIGLLGFAANMRRFSVFLVAYFLIYFGIFALGAQHGSRIAVARDLTWPFVIGMTFYHFRKYVPFKLHVLIVAAVVAFVSHGHPWFQEVFTLAWGYGLIYVGFLRYDVLLYYNRFGDYSYGMYIYAFPIEQIVANLDKGCASISLAAWAFPPTLVLAILSWHLVEKPASSRRTSTVRLLRRLKSAFHRPYARLKAGDGI